MTAERVTYLDSSAIVKLVVREPESRALRKYLRRRHPLVSSALARVEVPRAVRAFGEKAVLQANTVLSGIDLIAISSRVLAEAATLEPEEVRSLHAIHLATASLLQGSLSRLVCYDERMTTTAGDYGWTVHAPA